jgi:hypothetical protein
MIAVLRLIPYVNEINEHIEREFNLNRSNDYQMFLIRQMRKKKFDSEENF